MPLFILLLLSFGGPHWNFPLLIWIVAGFLTFVGYPTFQLRR
jgi:hypothetical protein